MDSAPTLIERLTYFRTCSPLQVIDISDQIFPSEVVPTAYLDGLDEPDRILCLRACLISWAISSGEKIPREMQLRTVLACWKKSDTLVSARTGSGKTLPMALAILLDDPAMNYKTITISPLKRLQSTQENNFNTCCGIETVVINEDTPRDEKWWNENVYNFKNNTPGRARHLIVTVEQLFKAKEGHYSRMGQLIRKASFQKLLARINVDEGHFIHTAGIKQHGVDPFRPAWGTVDELRALLASSIPWHLFSATWPPHICKTVESSAERERALSIRCTAHYEERCREKERKLCGCTKFPF